MQNQGSLTGLFQLVTVRAISLTARHSYGDAADLVGV
jgi:hypothetical protein